MTRTKLGLREKILTEKVGGELGETIAKLKDNSFRCCCEDQVLDEFRGYDHIGGLSDQEGTKYWAYWQCPKCHYNWSLGSIQVQTPDKTS